ncbi:MAG: hypothetical protein R6W78_15475 [Bacteroidales bacterium]
MKTNKIFVKSMLLILLMNSCLEYDITTRIHRNGRIERTFKVSGDYNMIQENSSMVLPADSTWEIKTWWELADSAKSKPDSVYNYAAKKTFINYKALNKALEIDSDIYNKIRIETSVKRKFRWFHTFFEYKETYKQYFPYDYAETESYLTKEEIAFSFSEDEDYRYNPKKNIFEPIIIADTTLVLSREDSARAEILEKDIEKRFEEWQSKNVFEDYYLALAKYFERINHTAYPSLEENKNMLYDSLNLKDNLDFEDSDENIRKMANKIFTKTAHFLNVADSKIQLSESSELQSFTKKLAFLNMNIWYKYHHKTSLPGIVIKSNAHETEGENCTWNIALKDFYADDFEMTATSKVLNKWAIVVSVALTLLLIAALIVGMKKKTS